MKNKLFYGLFVVYAAMVAFILYINGVFTGEVTSVSNLVINGIFLVVIGVLFLISAASFVRLNRLTDDLQGASAALQAEYKEVGQKNLWSAIQERRNIFEDEELQTAFNKYRMRIKTSRMGKASEMCDIEEYINEELLDRVGSSYFNAGISGTLTGLGILGTFMGLSLGLGSFNGNDIYTISDNVGPLLSGMKVAFHTSVYGILFSLIFNFVYRGIMADAYGKLEIFLNVFKQCAMPSAGGTDDSNLAAMLVYQANIANYMKRILDLARGESQGQTEAMENMVRLFMEQLQSVMGAQLKGLGDTLRTTVEAQMAEAQASKEVLETAKALAESNRSMMEAIERMMERQEMFAKDMEAQKQRIEAACEEISRDVSNQLFAFEKMRGLYEN